jgi:hypothetical protein
MGWIKNTWPFGKGGLSRKLEIKRSRFSFRNQSHPIPNNNRPQNPLLPTLFVFHSGRKMHRTILRQAAWWLIFGMTCANRKRLTPPHSEVDGGRDLM